MRISDPTNCSADTETGTDTGSNEMDKNMMLGRRDLLSMVGVLCDIMSLSSICRHLILEINLFPKTVVVHECSRILV